MSFVCFVYHVEFIIVLHHAHVDTYDPKGLQCPKTLMRVIIVRAL